VELQPWNNWEEYIPKADTAVISIEDVNRDEDLVSSMASALPVFAITENYLGARVYWHNDARFFSAPEVEYADDTGAGDIFAAAFFFRYFVTRDPWEAGRFAVLLASWSVTRKHLESIPTLEEIKKAKCELMAY
jgi:sugar/nucleoside kinase (ribokinase family)